jgi:hypothetical protein
MLPAGHCLSIIQHFAVFAHPEVPFAGAAINKFCLSICPQKDEFLRLVINSIRNDIICRNEAFQCLALNFIGGGMLTHRSPVCLSACHFEQGSV